MSRLNGVQTKFSLFNFPETKLSDPMVSTRKKSLRLQVFDRPNIIYLVQFSPEYHGGKMSTVLKLAHVNLLLSEIFYMQILFISIYIQGGW